VFSEVFPLGVYILIHHIYIWGFPLSLLFVHVVWGHPHSRTLSPKTSRTTGKRGFFGFDSKLSEDTELFKTANSDTSPRLPKEMMMDAETDQPAQLETLEGEFAQPKVQNATIMSQQAQILQKLRGTIPTLTSPTITLNSGTSDSKLKPAPPNEFDGSWSKGWAFLISCTLYVNLVPHQFTNDEKAVLCAISYMKTGRAVLFAQHIICHQTKYGFPKFTTWDEFRDAFITKFCLKNETGLAIAKLEMEKY
jgi:hypothetical protein